MTTDHIRGRRALVTGGGSGIGRQTALHLAAAGADVVLVGRNLTKLQRVAEEVRDLGQDPLVLSCDVSSAEDVSALAEQLHRTDVSILINNAGVAGPTAALADIDVADWDQVFASNVRSTFLMCKALIPALVERGGGDIVNVASVSGKRPLENRTPYVASKMAVIGLTATLAFEVGRLGVTVNSLSPGPVRGERMRANFERTASLRQISVEAAEQEFVSRAALGRMIEEEEVAQAVLAMLRMPGLCGADIDLSAGMIAR